VLKGKKKSIQPFLTRKKRKTGAASGKKQTKFEVPAKKKKLGFMWSGGSEGGEGCKLGSRWEKRDTLHLSGKERQYKKEVPEGGGKEKRGGFYLRGKGKG